MSSKHNSEQLQAQILHVIHAREGLSGRRGLEDLEKRVKDFQIFLIIH